MSQAELTSNNIRTYLLVAGIANGVAFLLDFLAYGRLGAPPTAQTFSLARTSAIMDCWPASLSCR